ncbi:MAG: DUF3108 domain-containing protein [Bacteroidia bacterium]|nr:DUF3108 domain-containing protein [Bacteroidia bacterium]
MRSIIRSAALVLLTGLFLALLPSPCRGQNSSVPASYTPRPFSDGEVLRYAVRWKFIRLGSIVIRQESQQAGSRMLMRVRMMAKSASGLPFIDVRLRNQALLQPAFPHCLDFSMKTEHDPAELTRYQLDTSAAILTMELHDREKLISKKTRKENRRVYDAVGMFMLVRGLAGSGGRTSIPVLIDGEIVESRAHSSAAIEYLEVPAFPKSLPVTKTVIRSDWVNNAAGGLGGNIDVWCTADGAALPLRAEMGIAIGSIVLELEEVQRPGWSTQQCAELRDSKTTRQGGAQ